MNPDFMKQLWVGYKPIGWLDVSVTDNIFKYPPPIQQQVQDARSDIYTQEIAKGKKIRDSDLYRVHAMDISDEKCCLELELMKWSELHIMKKYEHLGEQLMPDQYPNGIACACFVTTNNGYFVFGRRGSTSAGKESGSIAMIGGTLQPDEISVQDYQGFYEHILLELYEELGVQREYVDTAYIVGIQRMQNGGIGFLYHLSLSLTKDEVYNHFKQYSDDEFADIDMILTRDVEQYLYDASYKDGILQRTLGLNIACLPLILEHL